MLVTRERGRRMNLPNKITVFRVLTIPAILVLYMCEPYFSWNSRLAALILFVIAAASDMLDGYLARKRNLVTNFGKLMDPLADKMLVCSMLAAMTARGAVPAWVTILVVGRELYISGVRQLALERNVVVAASSLGKIKTILQMAMIVFLFFDMPEIAFFIIAKGALIYAASLFTVISAAEYTLKNKEVFRG
jgi:CDP-diacylglycerol--glycerol-3-phosphate 3-phosphatidyltransferase